MAYIMLDPGHGGNDPGASGQGLVEKERNLAVAQRVKYHLLRHGHKVDMTRDGDTNPSLSQRTNLANSRKVDILLSIHCNSFGSSSAKGLETFCYKFKYRKLADAVHNAVVSAGLYKANRGVKEGNLHVVRESSMSAALIEMAFISNPEDAALLKRTEDFAVAITKGILSYFGQSWKNESAPAPSPAPSTGFKVGDKVTVSKSATNYATGQSMASFVKGSTYTINELKSDRALLSSINSWVYLKDLTNNSGGSSFSPYTVKITADSLNVRKGPGTNYSVATTVKKGEVYTIVEVSNGWGKLKSGAGWISLDYTVKN